MSVAATPPAGRHLPRKRLGGACKACHIRKVRCSLAKSGPPCTNCSLDEIECEPRVRKPYRASASATRSRQAPRVPSSTDGDRETRETSITVVPPELRAPPATGQSPGAVRAVDGIDEAGDLSGPPEGAHAARCRARTAGARRNEPASGAYCPFPSHFSHFEEDDAPNADSLPADTPIYTDPAGVGALAHICEPEGQDKSGHYLLPNGISSSFDPDDLEYLRVKGAFVFPEAQVRNDLVRTYFHYVHPFFPVVDVEDFLPKHDSGALDGISAHLLWSMYLAACNYLDEAIVRAAGFATRKEMKRSFYKKAKALYDMQYERDRTTLIQAVLLMSFRSSDTEDKTGPRHWIGVALNLCQTAGLHRNPRSVGDKIPQRCQRLWRLIWWSCVHQDVWFSVGMGRPMRINLNDCDTPLPAPGDVDAMATGVPETLRERYLPVGVPDLSRLFTELMRLAVILTNILSTHYRARQSRPSDGDVAEIEQRISATHEKANAFTSSENGTVYYHACHLALFLQSVRVCLYRPYLLSSSQKIPSAHSLEWCSSMERKSQAAAAGFNQVLEALITSDMISTCQAITCIALVPPMQIHLLNSTSGKPLVASLGQNSLQLCMLVTDELRRTYFGAELVHRLFSQAKEQIKGRRTQRDAAGLTQAADGPEAEAEATSPPGGQTQESQYFTDRDTIRNLGSAFMGIDNAHGGFDFTFFEDLGENAPPPESGTWHWEITTQDCLQMSGLEEPY